MICEFLRIGIDIRSIAAAGQGRGLGIYAANLVKHLLQIEARHQYVLFLARNQAVPEFLAPTPTNATLVRLRRPTSNIFLWDQVLWYRLLKRLDIDVFHSLIYGVPLLCPCPSVLTIHDLTPLIFPHLLRKLRHKLVFRFNFFTGKFADHLLTVSTNSQQDIVRYLHIPKTRISVTLEGVSPVYRVIHDQAVLQKIKDTYGILGRYVLYVGGFDAHKNLAILIRAFALLRQREPQFRALTLVLVGGLGATALALQADVRAKNLDPCVRFTGYVPEDDVVGLFNAAELFVLPSLYEGFGLPILEAMACGAPVVCSQAASLPEVAGDAALYCAPDAPEEFCNTMYAILTNPDLRENLRRKGLAHVRQFSWDHTARETLMVYEHLVSNYQ